MECEKCKSTNIEVVKDEVRFNVNPYTYEQYETVTLYIKCNDCNHTFTETI